MDRETYTDPKVVGLASKLVSVKIDAATDEGGKVFAKFQGVGVPLMVFVSPKGKVVHKLNGFHPAATFTKDMQLALNRSK